MIDERGNEIPKAPDHVCHNCGILFHGLDAQAVSERDDGKIERPEDILVILCPECGSDDIEELP